ncbi:type 1 glutamine amidotransferase [Salipaludibacillus agaradhaerens]|uniref:type 1 glutamine amidotransferase domain-containing protein n=1 Tax=Salipaludibacillus agaradhaerens TaxID=76935 RepID=UPI002150DA9E|nr:type 1 glutamine amidotransferase domain-containing protein [Salipaludibacillus agaradhaerens]MCR6105180.1 type 1 glutamine amidotransferase [Salipaludibacillus agaradhaerens]MCR6117225.1 type 1 glutamine amidotransferase [Salipaludibacillus agaradhaerens]UJW56420.1 type 1 glutamine amidotransferase [Bacillus sp. A116_S68]
MSKVACVLTDMFEDSEYTSPEKAFKDAGHEVVVIGTEKNQEVEGKNGEAKVKVDVGIADAKPEEYDALFIPGGFSPDILRADDRFVEFSKHYMLKNKPVFAICHGPQLLITADILYGRKVTGFKSILVDLKHAGANVFDEEVVVCGNLVTSRTPDDLEAFNRESVNQLS